MPLSEISKTAMVLAAGLGTRMRPLTLEKPKPLQLVGGKTMLDHALDKLVEVGITRAVVNTHYLAEQIEAHLRSRRDLEIMISYEKELLETGGSIVKVLPYFENKPFFALNADLPCVDESAPALARMARFWDPNIMDVLLLVMRTEKARGFDVKKGDYMMKEDGHIWRKETQPPRPFVCISAQILKPILFNNPPSEVFSNGLVWDGAEARGRLFGLEHLGTCFHVGTPEDLSLANEMIASRRGWAV